MAVREIDICIPNIGDADQIELIEWHIREGESFSKGDELCDLVTDKAAFSLEAPEEGKLLEIFVTNKSTVKIGQKAARIQIIEK